LRLLISLVTIAAEEIGTVFSICRMNEEGPPIVDDPSVHATKG